MEWYRNYLSILIVAQLNFLLFMQIIASMNKKEQVTRTCQKTNLKIGARAQAVDAERGLFLDTYSACTRNEKQPPAVTKYT